jgi:hypothetical protein
MERPLNRGLHQKQPTLIEYNGSLILLNKRDKNREMKKTSEPTTPSEAAYLDPALHQTAADPAGISPPSRIPENRYNEVIDRDVKKDPQYPTQPKYHRLKKETRIEKWKGL